MVMILHLGQFDDVPLPHPLVLMPKVKWFNVTKHVWFIKTPMGKNTFEKLNKQLIDYIPTLKGKQINLRLGRALRFQER
jgi:hypothetical protein